MKIIEENEKMSQNFILFLGKHDVLKIGVLIIAINFFNYNLMVKINFSHFSF